MQEIAISKFKATCLAVLDRVRKTGEPVIITRFGQPVARIEPPDAQPPKRIKLGGGVGTMRILGDIVGPISDISDWEAAQDPEDET
ncbi:MAG: type II toxin-antitoxin system Phd/YefM family antitoxin [Candidatus Acidiferrum sp.]